VSSARAVFLDRDGTIIEDPGYLRLPEQVRLLPNAAAAIGRLNAAGLLAIVVTNQSAIARGLASEADYLATAHRLGALLEERGARLDAHFHCPHHPAFSGSCDCRKPGPLLYRRAAERFGIDLAASWWVGDRLRDVEAASVLGGSGILLAAPGSVDAPDRKKEFRVVPDLAAAVEVILHYLPRP